MTTLSILIPTLPERSHYLYALRSFLGYSHPIAFDDEVEILINDGSTMTTGAKRNELVSRATGKYVVHLDDDDLPSVSYVDEMLFWMRHLNVDAFGYYVQFYEDGVAKEVGEYSRAHHEYRCVIGPDGNQKYLRPISHITPVRTTIAKAVKFPDTSVCEDVAWTLQVKDIIRSAKFLPYTHYHYFYRNDKKRVETKGELLKREYPLWETSSRKPSWEDTTAFDKEVKRFQEMDERAELRVQASSV